MNKENESIAKIEEPTARITRARAKAFGTSSGIFPSSRPPFKQDQNRVLRANSKRAASDENEIPMTGICGLQHKRRAVLKDVTNIVDEHLYIDRTSAMKVQKDRRGLAKSKTKVATDIYEGFPQDEEDVKTKLAEELSKLRMLEPQDLTLSRKLQEKGVVEKNMLHSTRESSADDQMLLEPDYIRPAGMQKTENKICMKLGASSGLSIVNIDSNVKDPQACSFYAPDIYNNRRVAELNQRPSIDYMEKLQQDITPCMRGILIDWLVEVSEEYKLVPDTLYLTVNLIDRFLSQNYIEKQRLQLLGVTSMLIASKYEEICAPRVEEFCFITDNTYTRGEVLKMESQLLNLLHFQLSVPTTKTFLRRFIQATHTFYKVPCTEMEFLANYLAELTLLEYNFLKYLPSIVAASAVFLARWTLNQSDHPWNPTLEHYTSYKASELKTTVLELRDLQLNTNGCSLNAIREKYRQQKFKHVANLTSPERVLSLFE
ncbi:cyclin-A2-2 [Tripterygium wilfordii]|uniref:cyclin-A2-2 n=1 Tax=Tripterygium wilfordii TaxID=458696 RepID=UPI0018F7E54E|nr:cyclin-A2-2 [Tripterygium wilfordii]XP_038710677.1 cyclin-A2-2 [Tripterygium wilfordii]XP_038710678.1 cyclin-A2-2 [Tripterygium wilfordii]